MVCSLKKRSHEFWYTSLNNHGVFFLSDKEQSDNKNPSLAEDKVHQHLKKLNLDCLISIVKYSTWYL